LLTDITGISKSAKPLKIIEHRHKLSLA
jgi:hypothetical protein